MNADAEDKINHPRSPARTAVGIVGLFTLLFAIVAVFMAFVHLVGVAIDFVYIG